MLGHVRAYFGPFGGTKESQLGEDWYIFLQAFSGFSEDLLFEDAAGPWTDEGDIPYCQGVDFVQLQVRTQNVFK